MDRETKRRLIRGRDFHAERLPEIMLERRRLKTEGLALKTEKAGAEPLRLKSIRRRLNYIKTRLEQLRDEHGAVTAERETVNAALKAPKATAEKS